MTLLSIVKLVHLWGLVMGLGGAMLADYTIFRHAILQPVNRETVERIKLLSRIVVIGLGLLWISGIALVQLRLLGDPVYLDNPKLWSKISIVLVLTANGLIIHCFALPRLGKSNGQRLFDHTAKTEIAVMALVAAISSVSWLMPFVLGTASELNFSTPASHIFSVYGGMICVAWIGLYGIVMAMPWVRSRLEQASATDAATEVAVVPRARLEFALGV